jgi:hypothetical protein
MRSYLRTTAVGGLGKWRRKPLSEEAGRRLAGVNLTLSDTVDDLMGR